jgi:hypothetical protein
MQIAFVIKKHSALRKHIITYKHSVLLEVNTPGEVMSKVDETIKRLNKAYDNLFEGADVEVSIVEE